MGKVIGTGLVVWVGLIGGLRCKGWVNRVIINVINYRCNYIGIFVYKYMVKTSMYTISALYQNNNLNVST